MTLRIPNRFFLRLCLFFTGLFLMGFGIALCTRPGLGTSPVSSLPLVITEVFRISLGVSTIAVNLLYIASQIALLRRRFTLKNLLQLPALILFGLAIDLGMWITAFWASSNYLLRLTEDILGCESLAVGICFMLLGDITMMPGESLIKAISETFHFTFGNCKISFDISIVALAAIFSWLALHRLVGIREGTLLSALLVGFLIKLQTPLFNRLRKFLHLPEKS